MPPAPQPPRRDAGLMLLFLVPSLAQVLLVPIAPRPVGVAVALLSIVPLAWRRTHPAVATVLGSAAFVIPTHEGYLVLGYVVAAVLFFSTGAYVESLRRVGLVTACGLAVSVEAYWWSQDLVGVASSVLVVVGPVVAGRLVAVQRAHTERLQQLTAELDRERARAERTAVAEERARIARELHDVVGHEMTMIAIQSEAASAALRTAPDRATAPVEAIRETAHRATAEMRAILGVLGGDEPDSSTAVPGPDDLERLVERARLLGVECAFTATGAPWPDAPNTWLALVRIAQESLTNAGRHAPGAPVSIDVDWGEDVVTLVARNPCVGLAGEGGSGLGLAGMRERARVLGGWFEAGPDDGGFTVTVRLPRPWGAGR